MTSKRSQISLLAEKRFRDRASREGVQVIGEWINQLVNIECICPIGHRCFPSPVNIRRGTGWCRACTNQDPERSKANFLANAVRDNVIVTGDYVSSVTPVECICANGHECSPRPASIAQGQGWCKVCVNKDKKTAELKFRSRALAEGVTVVGEYVNTSISVQCICPRGHKCSPKPYHINHGYGWCVSCGQKYDRLYLISKNIDGAVWGKIGVANGIRRVKLHQHQGWMLEAEYVGISTVEALNLEKLLLTSIGPHATLLPEQMPQDGYSETFPYEYMPRVRQLLIESIPTTP